MRRCILHFCDKKFSLDDKLPFLRLTDAKRDKSCHTADLFGPYFMYNKGLK